ncbi:MAG: pseudouridine synthase [Planctomycetota bacterium]
MARERLQKYLARCGHGSRRRAELLIEKGLVYVNGEVADLGVSIIPGKDEVVLHGEKVQPPKNLTIMFHKTAGTITSTHDTHSRLTVMDMLPKRVVDAGVLPAGRLDLETEGMLIFTNDGDLLHRITHPRYRCRKEYFVVLSRAPSERVLEALRRGVFLPDVGKETSPAQITRLRRRKDGTASLHIVIHEGMKRQIRRMFSGQGLEVTYLKRISIGKLNLDDLAPGKYRTLRDRDLALLLKSDDEDEKSRPPHQKGRGGRAGSGGSGRRAGSGRKAGPGKGRR